MIRRNFRPYYPSEKQMFENFVEDECDYYPCGWNQNKNDEWL